MAEIPRAGAGGLSASPVPPQENVSIGTPARSSGSSGESSSSPGGPTDGTQAAAVPGKGSGASDVSTSTASKSEPALGAGGTSLAAEQPEDDGGGVSVSNGASGAAKVAGAAAAVPAASMAGQALVFAMFINYLKGMMMTLMALASNLWNLAMGLLLAAGKAVAGAIMTVGTAVSTAVGGAVSAAVAGSAAVISGTVAVVIVVASSIFTITTGSNIVMRDSPLVDCTVHATAALENVEGSEGAVDEKTTANARTIYSVLAAWGMPDENVAGIIGNWDAESGIDPTSVQNHFSSPHVMSDQKRSAATNTENGIGLGQWTFGRNANLREYADTHNEDWWTLNIQLGFMLSAAEGSDADIVKDMIASSKGSAADAALYFHEEWERSADTAEMAKRRATYANTWMGLFSGWDKNQALADSILAQAGTTVDGANNSRAEAVRSDCKPVGEEQDWIADGTAPGPWGGYANGKIPLSALTPIPWSDRGPMLLRSDATKALGELNAEFKSVFGYDIPINSAYRDFAAQVEAREEWCAAGKCQNAATPGTSNHGWALAVDIATKNHAAIHYTSPEYLWLKKNAGKYGWVHPAYMEPGGTGPFEPWHWEYYGVTKS